MAHPEDTVIPTSSRTDLAGITPENDPMLNCLRAQTKVLEELRVQPAERGRWSLLLPEAAIGR